MRDIRYAVRILRKSPAFTISAIVTLALCVGANTAIYTVVDRVLLRPLPYPHADRLALVVRHYEGAGGDDDVSQAGVTWVALRDGAQTVDLAVFSGLPMGVNLVEGDRAEYVMQQRVSSGYFRVLGVAPAIGREFTLDEDRGNGPMVALLSHALWTRAFNADASIVGRSVIVRGEPHLVVGVMPAGFVANMPADIWTPLRPSPTGEGGGENYALVARLRDGVGWSQADSEVTSLTTPVVRERYRSSRFPVSIRLVPLQRGQTRDVRRPILVLWAAVGVVLLIGCVNIAGLLMARGVARAPEFAMRLALGGRRSAIVRQLLVESLVLSVCGAAAGILVGDGASRACAALLEDAFGITGDVGLDGRVLAITTVIALSTSVLFGLLPAVQATRVDLRPILVEAGNNAIAGAARTWPRRLLVAGEVALGVALLVGAGLLIRSFDRLMRQPPGFDGTHVMTATLSLQDARYRTPERVTALFTNTLERMRQVPGVQSAAVALTLPYERALNNGFRWPGESQGATINVTYVTPEYFSTLRIPLRRGRTFTDADGTTAAPVAVVNEAFVRRHSRDRDPIGRAMIAIGTRTIVGVVGDIQTKTAFGNFGPVGAAPAAYIPATQTSGPVLAMMHTWFSPSWFVRTTTASRSVSAEMRGAVEAVDPLLPFAKFRTLDDVRGEAVAAPRAQAVLLAVLAALALLLAGVGVYGLVANLVAERTRELGIRMALGATTTSAIRVVVLPAAALAVSGVVAGLVIARAAAATLQHLVWGVSVGDPVTFAAAAALVLVVAAVATLVPAVRITRLNPIRALRHT